MSEVRELSFHEFGDLIMEESGGNEEWAASVAIQVAGWVQRGDGAAVYRNEDLGHPGLGERKIVSFGSPAAQIETLQPPEQLPDIGGAINWRYRLESFYWGRRDA